MTNELQPEMTELLHPRCSARGCPQWGQSIRPCSDAAHDGALIKIRSVADRASVFFSGGNHCAGKSLRKMLPAQWHVALIAADFDLRSLAFRGAVGLDTHHHDGLAAAMTNG